MSDRDLVALMAAMIYGAGHDYVGRGAPTIGEAVEAAIEIIEGVDEAIAKGQITDG